MQYHTISHYRNPRLLYLWAIAPPVTAISVKQNADYNVSTRCRQSRYSSWKGKYQLKRNETKLLSNWESIFKPNTAYAETINILTTTSYTGVVFILTNTIYTKENISNKYNSYKRKQFNKILVKQVSNTLPRVYIYNLFSIKLSL